MRSAVLIVLLVACAQVQACEWTFGPGAGVRLGDGKSGGLATVGCVFRDRWEVRAWWVGEQTIYGGSVSIDAFPAVSASRLWTFRDGKRLQPVLGFGVLLKESQRCRFDGDLDCNRQVPLSFCFLPSAGIRFGDVLVTAFHCSNASLDHGPEKKNLGLDGIRAEVRF